MMGGVWAAMIADTVVVRLRVTTMMDAVMRQEMAKASCTSTRSQPSAKSYASPDP